VVKHSGCRRTFTVATYVPSKRTGVPAGAKMTRWTECYNGSSRRLLISRMGARTLRRRSAKRRLSPPYTATSELAILLSRLQSEVASSPHATARSAASSLWAILQMQMQMQWQIDLHEQVPVAHRVRPASARAEATRPWKLCSICMAVSSWARCPLSHDRGLG
jgi:hypothetical protein